MKGRVLPALPVALKQALDDVRRLFSTRNRRKGRLRLDVPITLARAVIIPALGDFQNRYRILRLYWHGRSQDDLIAERVDCVIRPK